MTPEHRSLMTIWLAFIPSHLVIFGVRFAFEPAANAPSLPLFAALIAAFLVASLAAPRFLAGMPANTAWTIRFALAEAVGLMGFVWHALGGGLALGAVASGLALGLHLLTRPSAEAYTAWEMARSGVDPRQR